MLLLALACAAPPRLLTEPDAARDGAPGADGAYGAAAIDRTYAARVTDTVATTVVYPSDTDGALAATNLPIVVFVQGGFVNPARYEWLAAHFATRGMLVALPAHDLALGLFSAGNASAALDGLLADAAGNGPLAGAASADSPALIGGHSLGGTTSALAWVDDDRFAGLFLAASYPASDTDVAARGDAPVLALVGSADGLSDPDTVAENLVTLGTPLGVVEGLNHYGWTDDASERDLASDGATDRPVPDARADLLVVVDTWTEAVFVGDADALAALPATPFEGVTFRESR